MNPGKPEKAAAGPARAYYRYQQAGERALQDKRYDLAKRAFDQALSQAAYDPNQDTSTLIAILDLRVEARIKLRDYDAAIKDARTMVRHERTDPRGYLRCGQLHALKNDLVGALVWYQQGLKNVPHTNEDYHRLESMSLRTTGKSAMWHNKFRDPLAVLPMDLIQILFSYLEIWEATSCLRVSRTWRNTLLAIHGIWTTIDFRGGSDVAILRHLKACIRRFPRPPTTIHLDSMSLPAVEFLRPYLTRWKATQHLSINLPDLMDLSPVWTASTTLKSLHVGRQCPVRFRVVYDVLHICNMLQSARFDFILGCYPSRIEGSEPSAQDVTLPNLRSLVLTAAHAYAEDHELRLQLERGLLRNFPNLKELSCTGCIFSALDADLSAAHCLRHLTLRDVSLEHDLKLPSSLEALGCGSISYSRSNSSSPTVAEPHPKPFEALPHLTSLQMKWMPDPSSRLFDMITQSIGARLTILDLGHCETEASHIMVLLDLGKLSRLTFLRTFGTGMTDETLARIAAACPLLEEVELCGLRITGVAIKQLCTRTALRRLQLTYYPHISPDAIAWARDRGVAVAICPQ